MKLIFAGIVFAIWLTATVFMACRTKAPTEPGQASPRVQDSVVCSPDSVPPCFLDPKPRAP